ncbi:trypsin-like peptidase domain-containing protein [Magnetospirillum sp. LM-5]|uniref:trypsin-like peptidase domain-containing protein n=1 Tax=Magnetospirillum sp. LM-5 TaxID=2681466 RepID=UPI0015715309|nr:trypsin-like peptidase domain-containing protein [Magnetospirillum sp. LM-5]
MRSTFRLAPSLIVLALVLGGCRTIQDVAYVKGSDAANEGRYEEAFERFKSVAAVDGYDGQASAQYRLGEMYLNGQGTRRDPAAAKRMFELAAANTDRSWRRLALYKLGAMHDEGMPGVVTKDRLKAAEYFKKAADDGYDIATDRLKSLQRHPEVFVPLHPEEFTRPETGVAPAGLSAAFKAFERGDAEGALKIFMWHAKKGNEQAQAAVAKFYKDGLVVPKDPAKYAGWAWLAARNGNPQAQFEMGLLYNEGETVPGSDDEALRWFSMASTQGLAEATNWLGIIAANPVDKNVKPDWEKAVGHFRKAAEGGSVFALVNLGDAMVEGRGLPKDADGARRLYQKAADAGNVVARRKLIEMGLTPIAKAAETPVKPMVATKSAAAAVAIPSATPTAAPAPVPPVPVAPPPPVVVSMTVPLPKPSPVEIYSKLSPSVFRLIAVNVGKDGGATGSAVALTGSLAITNCHVTDGHDGLGAKLGGQVAVFRVINGNRKKDMCVIKADQRLVPATDVRRYSDLKVGEKVYAIGSPKSLENTISEGIVSGLRTSDGVRYVQTTAPIAPGSSGGGLFDEEGRLIGITTWKVPGEGNLNFAVAVDEALEVLDRSK